MSSHLTAAQKQQIQAELQARRAALGGIRALLITGSHPAQIDFERYAEIHRPALLAQIVGCETAAHPSEKPLIAMARRCFVRFDRLAGTTALG